MRVFMSKRTREILPSVPIIASLIYLSLVFIFYFFHPHRVISQNTVSALVESVRLTTVEVDEKGDLVVGAVTGAIIGGVLLGQPVLGAVVGLATEGEHIDEMPRKEIAGCRFIVDVDGYTYTVAFMTLHKYRSIRCSLLRKDDRIKLKEYVQRDGMASYRWNSIEGEIVP